MRKTHKSHRNAVVRVQKFVTIRSGVSFPRMRDFAQKSVYSASFFLTHTDKQEKNQPQQETLWTKDHQW